MPWSRCLITSLEKPTSKTRTDVGTRKWIISVADVTVFFVCCLFVFVLVWFGCFVLFGGIWKTLGLWTRKAVVCTKQGFITGHPRSLEHSAESQVDKRLREKQDF